MNQLTAQQRKIVYAAVAVLLFVPILLLGAPASQQKESGGTLARLRYNYELGEASLGDVDPTSATMNLVLLGLRGVAASVLWQQADYQKMTKDFNQLERTIESIILLQPHFKAVWEYQAWNLAFNVSAECDAVEDRFAWVKRGAKFLKRGTERNQKVPELFFEMGRFFGQKIGRADEKETFRKFFVHDPDVKRWKGGPDEEINPEGKDNYLVARDWYMQANQILETPGVTQHKMDLALFLAYPYRSQMDYATALQSDGVRLPEGVTDTASRQQAYDEWAQKTQQAWATAYREWTQDYGRREIQTAANMGGVVILERDDAQLRAIAEREGMPYDQKLGWQEQYRKTTHYPYWKQRCDIEQRPTTTQAHYDLAEGKRLYHEVQDFEGARFHLERGMKTLQEVIDQYERPDGTNGLLADERDTIVEEAIKSILIWRRVKEYLLEPIPEDFPLKRIWTDPQFEGEREELTHQFDRWAG